MYAPDRAHYVVFKLQDLVSEKTIVFNTHRAPSRSNKYVLNTN